MKLVSGHDAVSLEGAELEKQREDWKGYHDLVRLNPGRWLFPANFTQFADKYYNFKYKSSDVVIMTYPKCGTTWTQEIIWTMRNNPDLNNPMANVPLMIRVPFLEEDMLSPIPKPGEDLSSDHTYQFFKKSCPDKNPEDGMYLQMSDALPEPRTIKTHLSFSLMPPSLLDTTKVVYVARNPKDLIVSYHHHCRILKPHGFAASFQDFVQYFVDDDLLYGPYGLHMKEAWERKSHPNLHIMFFEDLKANPMEEYRKLDTFLGTKLTEKQLESVVKYTSFGEMKSRNEKQTANLDAFNVDRVKKDGGMFRKGESGDWKGKFTPASEAKVDQWIKENMASFGVNFKYGV